MENSYVDIKLSNSPKTTRVSIKDTPRLGDVKNIWLNSSGYAMIRNPGSSEPVSLHRYLRGIKGKPWFEVDHINRNRLDNRRSNLRLTSKKQNNHNRGPLPNRAKHGFVSAYKGVNFDIGSYNAGKKSCWRARILHNGKRRSLGRYETQEEAGIAYNIAAKELNGTHAYLNVIDTQKLPDDVKDRIKSIELKTFRVKSSKYRGVSKIKHGKGKWEAYIGHNNKKINLGCFSDEKMAAKAYNAAAREYQGERALLNPV